MLDGDPWPVQHRGREVEVAIALPDAEVAGLGCGGEASQMVEGSLGLLHVGRVVLGDVNASFHLAGLGGVGDEAQPGVGREVWWTEIDELLPGDAGMNIQSAQTRRCSTEVSLTADLCNPFRGLLLHRSGRVEVLVIGLVPDTAPLPADPPQGVYRPAPRDPHPA